MKTKETACSSKRPKSLSIRRSWKPVSPQNTHQREWRVIHPVLTFHTHQADFSMADLAWPWLYNCYKCQNHVCCHDDIVSKSFQAESGRAFLFSHAMNVLQGPKEDRQLITGLHTVADVHCSYCGEVLGWKYEKAYEELQKYKEGKFVLAKFKIVKANW